MVLCNKIAEGIDTRNIGESEIALEGVEHEFLFKKVLG
ncbi:hypothetical protein LEP1GSC045_1912 [Leptospira interrogans serovar Pomona str. Kennewicki LC82-25]|nr:hypothetical protein LEP1GSC045_3853 [Leptospira interrogans serovar Pomona str. Kennewicki LC82-25]EJO79780.1 hypothetical protein LEP1GSC045_1912 [Leptospira interrogans serovar Pomona str. Kennewicki LC82-25]